MKQNIYFAGSIRGGRKDATLYHELIEEMKKTDVVLTEHIGDLSRSVFEQSQDKDQEIYIQDVTWLKESDLVIAECTNPSLGVGYELAYAERYNIPTYIFYRPNDTQLSAMLKGNPYFQIYSYHSKEELFDIVHTILGQNRR
ncbi:MAG: nucleoside 2-deoxyribosyltransferase [Solobacterium sp.]|nr:nucleoside 2-deoxyribosyltransferase [Solobacterium sp.]